jgi:hypothetical protein
LLGAVAGDLVAFAAVFAATWGAFRLFELTVRTPALFGAVLLATYLAARTALHIWPSRFRAGFSGLVLGFVVCILCA